MSVSYGKAIVNSQQGGAAFRILFLWEGSIYKLIGAELIIYVALYTALSLVYRLALEPASRQDFERMVKFCYEKDRDIPLSFLLAFFVSGIIARWWQMYMSIPWMNRLAALAQAFITSSPEEAETARQIRLNLMRHVNLGWILGLSPICRKLENYFQEGKVCRRRGLGFWQLWPKSRGQPLPVGSYLTSINSSSEVRTNFGKLATNAEIETMVQTGQRYCAKYGRAYCPEYWVPMQWATRLCKQAMLHGYCDVRTMSLLIHEIEQCRRRVQNLINYTNVLIPLVYTQVVIIAVYSYFLLQLFSQQFISAKATADALSRQLNRTVKPIHIVESVVSDEHHGQVFLLYDRIDLFVPVFGIFRFLFLMGWMKVAMCLINPFGNDDEDFQILDILDYNLKISARTAFSSYTVYPEPIVSGSLSWTTKQDGCYDNEFITYLKRTQKELTAAQTGSKCDDFDSNGGSAEGSSSRNSQTEILV